MDDQARCAATPRDARQLGQVGSLCWSEGKRKLPQGGCREMAERVSRALLGECGGGGSEVSLAGTVRNGPRIHTAAEPYQVAAFDEPGQPEITDAEVLRLRRG